MMKVEPSSIQFTSPRNK